MKIDMNKWKNDAAYRKNMKKLFKIVAENYRKAAEKLDNKKKSNINSGDNDGGKETGIIKIAKRIIIKYKDVLEGLKDK